MPISKATPKNKALFDDLVTKLRERIRLNDAKREATNAFNRHNTKVCDAFKHFVQEESFPAKTAVVIDGARFTWEVAESEKIDPRLWHEMWKNNEITESQYFDALSILKDEAKAAIGEDQVATISRMIPGKKADIRVDDDNAGSEKGARVELPAAIQPPKGIRPRVTVQVPAPKPRVGGIRKINVVRR